MAKRNTVSRVYDLKSWNFILFLTLAFVLLVVMLNAMSNVALDVRTKAGLTCPRPELPRPEGCPGGWTYMRDSANGCPVFSCKQR